MTKKTSVTSDFGISGWIDPAVRKVLDRLEARSADKQAHLEQLRVHGGSSIRDIASKLMLDVGSEVGLLLNLLVRLNGSRRIVEVGASVGYSTLWLAEAARATGGKVLTFEPDAIKVEELYTENLMMSLLETYGRLSSHNLVYNLCKVSRRTGVDLKACARSNRKIMNAIDPVRLDEIFDIKKHPKNSAILIGRVLNRARKFLASDCASSILADKNGI
jgi:hypothetical protein